MPLPNTQNVKRRTRKRERKREERRKKREKWGAISGIFIYRGGVSIFLNRRVEKWIEPSGEGT